MTRLPEENRNSKFVRGANGFCLDSLRTRETHTGATCDAQIQKEAHWEIVELALMGALHCHHRRRFRAQEIQCFYDLDNARETTNRFYGTD